MFHRALKTKLTDKGFSIAGEFSCKGLDTYKIFGTFGGMNKGHPDENDIKKAKESVKGFAKNLP
jgi:flavodoxin